jgi:hypothetical protein
MCCLTQAPDGQEWPPGLLPERQPNAQRDQNRRVPRRWMRGVPASPADSAKSSGDRAAHRGPCAPASHSRRIPPCQGVPAPSAAIAANGLPRSCCAGHHTLMPSRAMPAVLRAVRISGCAGRTGQEGALSCRTRTPSAMRHPGSPPASSSPLSSPLSPASRTCAARFRASGACCRSRRSPRWTACPTLPSRRGCQPSSRARLPRSRRRPGCRPSSRARLSRSRRSCPRRLRRLRRLTPRPRPPQDPLRLSRQRRRPGQRQGSCA